MDKKTTIAYKEEENKTYTTSNVPKDNECLQRLNKKLDRLEQENEELKRKVEEYYDLWQSELMERDCYEDM